MRIRDALEEDVEPCVRLLSAHGLELAEGGYADEHLVKAYLADLFLVACEDGVCGCIIGEPVRGGAIVWFLVVDGAYRRQGIGSSLLAAFEERARSLGAEWIILSAPLDALGSRRFYDDQGYLVGGSFSERKKIL